MGGAFTDLLAWREAAQLAADTIIAASQIRGVGAQDATNQIVRAAESIPANIAEGYAKGINRDCIRFMRIARGSAAELESRLRVAMLARRLPDDVAMKLIGHCRRVRFLITRYMESVEHRMAA